MFVKKPFIRIGLIAIYLLSLGIYAQDYERIDATILLYPNRCNSPEDLSKFITRDFITDEEKVRAIYSWIIQNIEYDPKEYKKFDYSFKHYRERNLKEEETREKIIQRTIQSGVAVCEGYAMLFERLCELQGIDTYLVRGDTKSNFQDIGRPFDTVHMWNVAYIDGKPYLFDSTWGAGKYHQKFIKDTSYFYFKTPPQQFIKSHYPDLFEDAFISETISRTDFSMMPLIIDKHILYSDLQSPKKGIIYSELYFDEIQFSLMNVNPENVKYSYGDEKIPVNNFEILDQHLTFSVPLQLGVKNLLIYFEDKPVLGYQIK